MKFIPFTKKIEVDAGYKAFYKKNRDKFEVYVVENGIKVIVSKETQLKYELTAMKRYFKPYLNMMSALEYAKSLGEISEECYLAKGFVLVNDLSIA